MLGTIFIIIGIIVAVAALGVSVVGITGYIDEKYPTVATNIRDIAILCFIVGFVLIVVGIFTP